MSDATEFAETDPRSFLDDYPEGLGGHVERFDAELGISGWAMNINAPEQILTIEMVVDDQVIAQCKTGIARPDVTAGRAVEASPGFRFAEAEIARLAPIACFCLDREVTFRIAETLHPLACTGEAPTLARLFPEEAAQPGWATPAEFNLAKWLFELQLQASAMNAQPERPRPGQLAGFIEPDPELERQLAFERSVISEEFDLEFYLANFPDLVGASLEPIVHYLQVGWREGRDPSPDFSTNYYLGVYPDVRRAGINPFVHFVGWGRAEGRLGKEPPNALMPELDFVAEIGVINDHFDTEFYLKHSPDLSGAQLEPVVHYLQAGWREGRDPSPDFSTTYYLNTYPDVSRTGINPFVHFVGWGRAEGRLGKEPPNAVMPALQYAPEIEAVKDHFDPTYYLSHSPDLAGQRVDLLIHYMTHGWKELRDPSASFSTRYYLDNNPDIRAGGGNPFFHYIKYGRFEGRKGLSFSDRMARRRYEPLVTVIIPNFNHARFLQQRIDSILAQTYPNFEILILDDASKDNSVEVIRRYEAAHPDRIRTILNKENSGNVFAQWRRGVGAVNGELFWICESDDFCEPTFLEYAVKPLADPSINISFGQIQFADRAGQPVEGLDGYREQAEPSVWSVGFARPASEWFRGTFAISNVIPNVGGCVIRHQHIPDAVWDEAMTYRISGDWYLYSQLAAGGRIAYVPEAIAYFRQHGQNTSVSGFQKPHYYSEHEKVITTLREQWGTPDDVVARFYVNIYRQFKYAKAERVVGNLSDLFSNDRVLSAKKRRPHILMCFLGFHLGGGELFPIHLANELLDKGYIVSMLCLDSENENPAVRKMLDSRIAIYDTQLVDEIGIDKFLDNAGVDLIHSHSIAIEYYFFQKHRLEPNIPYIVTLHGSYEVTPLPDDLLLRVLRAVSHWVYLSEKNLRHLRGIPLSGDHVSFVANGMSDDPRPFPKSRAQLGIGESDLVFMIASRAIAGKGWRPAIEALKCVQSNSSRALHLLLCGTGPEADLLVEKYDNDPQIHLMGFQECINGAYRMSDVAMLPTRFPGESYPLTLIQAMQVGRPIISTDIGEIRNMIVKGDLMAGVVVEINEDDNVFVEALSEAIHLMLDDDFRAQCAKAAATLGNDFSIASVAQKYVGIYQSCLLAKPTVI